MSSLIKQLESAVARKSRAGGRKKKTAKKRISLRTRTRTVVRVVYKSRPAKAKKAPKRKKARKKAARKTPRRKAGKKKLSKKAFLRRMALGRARAKRSRKR